MIFVFFSSSFWYPLLSLVFQFDRLRLSISSSLQFSAYFLTSSSSREAGHGGVRVSAGGEFGQGHGFGRAAGRRLRAALVSGDDVGADGSIAGAAVQGGDRRVAVGRGDDLRRGDVERLVRDARPRSPRIHRVRQRVSPRLTRLCKVNG